MSETEKGQESEKIESGNREGLWRIKRMEVFNLHPTVDFAHAPIRTPASIGLAQNLPISQLVRVTYIFEPAAGP